MWGISRQIKKNGYGKLYDKNGTLIKEGIWDNGIYQNTK